MKLSEIQPAPEPDETLMSRSRLGTVYHMQRDATLFDQDTRVGPPLEGGRDLVTARLKASNVCKFSRNILLIGKSSAEDLGLHLCNVTHQVYVLNPACMAISRIDWRPGCAELLAKPRPNWYDLPKFHLLISGCDQITDTGDMVTVNRRILGQINALRKCRLVGSDTLVVAVMTNVPVPQEVPGQEFLQADVLFQPDREECFTKTHDKLRLGLSMAEPDCNGMAADMQLALAACGSDEALYNAIADLMPPGHAEAWSTCATRMNVPDYAKVYGELMRAVYRCGDARSSMETLWWLTRQVIGRAQKRDHGNCRWMESVDTWAACDLES